MRTRHTIAIVIAVTGCVALTAPRGDTHAAEILNHDFVGAERCRSCHVEEFEMWSKGPHARAMDSLRDAEKRDARCTQCHTMVPADPDPRLTGIQCETCHGPGRYYAKDHVMRDSGLRERLYYVTPDEKSCRTCHTDNTPSLRPFSFPDAKERIRHWATPKAPPTAPPSDG